MQRDTPSHVVPAVQVRALGEWSVMLGKSRDATICSFLQFIPVNVLITPTRCLLWHTFHRGRCKGETLKGGRSVAPIEI